MPPECALRGGRAKGGAREEEDGSWFVVDEVVGKHEMIQYAVALSPSGAILGVEILEHHLNKDILQF